MMNSSLFEIEWSETMLQHILQTMVERIKSKALKKDSK
jgi:hypothetical protein